MCALQLAVRLAQEEDQRDSGGKDIEATLQRIDQQLADLSSD